MKPETKKFLSQYKDRWVPDYTTGCLNWVASRVNGYGQVHYQDRVQRTHRLVCELEHGPPPPRRNNASHLCNNPACIRPDHLVWESYRGNTQRKRLGLKGNGTRPKGKKWEARSYKDGKQVYIGIFDTEAEAARAVAVHVTKENARKAALPPS